MNTSKLHLHCSYTNLSHLSINIPLIIPIKATKATSKSSHLVRSKATATKSNQTDKPLVLEVKSYKSNIKLPVISSDEHSRMVVLGAASVGLALFLMGFEDHKAWAFGPGGPLMEDFWDNMRRYALYALTVSTGAIYTLLQPIVELLKNPISAVLIVVIIGGSIFVVSQVVTAMVGLSDFSYDYSY